jgi:serine/threonine-protein kinase
VQVAHQHVTNRVPAPSALLPGLDPAIDALVARATAREPGERPVDANALRTLLRQVYANLPDAALDFTGATAHTDATQQLQGGFAGATRPDVAPTRVDVGPRVSTAAAAGRPSPLPPVAPRRNPDEPYRLASPQDSRPHRYRGLIIFLVIVVLAAAAALGAWLYGSTHYQSMPDLTGLSKSQAEQAVTNDGLKYQLASASSTSVQSGDVVSTKPGSGRPIADGGTVTLTISSGPAQVAVPDVQGLSQSDATDKLTSAGFKVAVASSTQHSNTVAAGDVAAYSPNGTETQGTTITLILSAGAGQATVPRVTGESLADATKQLQQDGFTVVTHHVTLLFNTVVSQDPGAGDSTQPGATVTLYY